MASNFESNKNIKLSPIMFENSKIEYQTDEEEDDEEEEEYDEIEYDEANDHYILTKSKKKNVETGISYAKSEVYEVDYDASEMDDDGEEVIVHVCAKCDKTFTDVNILKKHLTFCSETIRQMWTNLRDIEGESVEMLLKNICFCCDESLETCHAGHIRCPECTKSFRNTKSYERHVFLIHSNSDEFPCQICNAKCPSQTILNIHEEHHKNCGKPFACKKCGKEFTRQYHLVRHIKFSGCDGTKGKDFECNVCSKVFFRIDNLRNHLRSHLGENTTSKDYPCPYCDKCFYGTSTLNIHIRTHTGEKPFACDLCEKFFPSNAALRKHRRYHTGEKPYQCTLCERAFVAKEVLNRHMKIHTGERPHACTVCTKSFIQATQLKNHMKRHNGDIGGFECALCDQNFNRKSKLTKHLIDDHASSNAPLFKCSICLDDFKSAAGLKRHTTRTHKNKDIGELICHICNEEFEDIKNLNFHKLTHPDDSIGENELIPVINLNQCNICFETFGTSGGLKIHITRKHKAPQPHIPKVPKSEKDTTPRLLNGISSSSSSPPKRFKSPPRKLNKHKVQQTNTDGEIIEEYVIEEIPEECIEIEPPSKVLSETIINGNVNPIRNEKNLTDESEEIMMIYDNNESKLDDKVDAEATKNNNALAVDDTKFKENITKLLNCLVDEKTLNIFGWPNAPVETVLRKVILNCGHQMDVIDSSVDYITRMREYVKIFFSVVVESDSIKDLLNNLTIDEVIDHFVSMAEEDE